MTLNDATIANIRAARTVNGVPPEHAQVPFRNMRHLLSLHATVTPDKIFLIHYDAEAARGTDLRAVQRRCIRRRASSTTTSACGAATAWRPSPTTTSKR